MLYHPLKLFRMCLYCILLISNMRSIRNMEKAYDLTPNILKIAKVKMEDNHLNTP